MSVSGAAIRYDLPPLAAYAQPVEPVRPLPDRPERNSDRGEGTQNTRRFELLHERRANSEATVQDEPRRRATVVPFPTRASRALDFAPFVAQQLAQQGEPEVAGIDGRASAQAAAAYRQAAGDTELVLGFVRPLRLSV